MSRSLKEASTPDPYRQTTAGSGPSLYATALNPSITDAPTCEPYTTLRPVSNLNRQGSASSVALAAGSSVDESNKVVTGDSTRETGDSREQAFRRATTNEDPYDSYRSDLARLYRNIKGIHINDPLQPAPDPRSGSHNRSRSGSHDESSEQDFPTVPDRDQYGHLPMSAQPGPSVGNDRPNPPTIALPSSRGLRRIYTPPSVVDTSAEVSASQRSQFARRYLEGVARDAQKHRDGRR